MWALVLKTLGRAYLVNISDLESQIITSILFLLFEGNWRLAQFIRVRFFWSLFVSRDAAHRHAASWLNDPVLLLVDYALLLAEFVGLFLAFSATLIVRWWYSLPMDIGVAGISFLVQLFCELVSAFGGIYMQCLFYGFRFRATLWLTVQHSRRMLYYALMTIWPFVLVTALMRNVMINPI